MSYYCVSLKDPSTHETLVFKIEEESNIPASVSEYICFLVFYNVTDRDSFLMLKKFWLPELLTMIKTEFAFVMIIGTHADLEEERQISNEEGEEYAASQGVLHIEVSTYLHKNLELTKRLMRIRAAQLLRKHPELKECVETDLVNISSPKDVRKKVETKNKSRLELTEDLEDLILEEFAQTPQFSKSRLTIKDKKQEEVSSSKNFSFPIHNAEMPMPVSDFTAMKLRKRNRYSECEKDSEIKRVSRQASEYLDEELSFANMSGISRHEEDSQDSTPEILGEDFKITVGNSSPANDSFCSVVHKVPPIPNLPSISSEQSLSQTERRSPSPVDAYSTHDTERVWRNPLMVLEVDLGLGRLEKIEIYEGESAFDIAERCLGNYRSNSERIHILACQIEDVINSYCKEIRTFIKLDSRESSGTDTERSKRSDKSDQVNPLLRNASSKTMVVNSSTEYESDSGFKTFDISGPGKLERKPSFNNLPLQMPGTNQKTLKNSQNKYGKMLFKLQVKVGTTRGEIVVRHGDCLEEVAEKFAVENSLDFSSKARVLDLLRQAGGRHKNRLRNDVVY